MVHRIKINSKTFKVYSLNAREIEEIFKNPPALLKKSSIILSSLNIKLTVKIFEKNHEKFLIKYGIIISKKIGKANKRNFLKRRIREIFTQLLKKRLLKLSSGPPNPHFEHKFFLVLFILKKIQNIP